MSKIILVNRKGKEVTITGSNIYSVYVSPKGEHRIEINNPEISISEEETKDFDPLFFSWQSLKKWGGNTLRICVKSKLDGGRFGSSSEAYIDLKQSDKINGLDDDYYKFCGRD